MNNGLPSLLDAIFGKNDLTQVSLEEMYEVVSEFPSFNAAHFLLSKKLKELNDTAYEKQSMRTALYFNNAFWLQTLLNEGNHSKNEEFQARVKSRETDHVDQQEEVVTETFSPDRVEPEEKIAEVPDEVISEPTPSAYEALTFSDQVKGAVTSFDELLSKYKIDLDPDTAVPARDKLKEEWLEEFNKDAVVESVNNETGFQEQGEVQEIPEEIPSGKEEESITFFPADENSGLPESSVDKEPISEKNTEQFEVREEVLNEYGIFEEVIVKKTDLDLAAFDRPIDQVSTDTASVKEEYQPLENTGTTETEMPVRYDSPDKTDVHDYEAFDRPIDQGRKWDDALDDEELDEEIKEILDEKASENPEPYSEPAEWDADDTEQTASFEGESTEESKFTLPDSTDRFKEHQKPIPVFDPKKTESIVFAPYHMIDYFASQGIKLVLEDNPPDHFGQQLKSFTDWLKVMKKLPANQQSPKTDERENERIRHFAAHSIEERDVLTESMAEVLAKQGMFENAIALYQKLSLIYPPKSAYFASRIEQLKASLP